MLRNHRKTSTLLHNQAAETRISGFVFFFTLVTSDEKSVGSGDEIDAAGFEHRAVFNEECGLISEKDYSTNDEEKF